MTARGARATANPRTPRVKLSETAVGLAVASFVSMVGGRIYNAETGFLGHWEDDGGGGRRSVGRKGGTRSTPGTPDMPVVFMCEPWRYTLTVELKGSDTAIKDKDWNYCLDAATYGQPHLLVRSGEEFLTGLRYLGLLPARLLGVRPQDWDAWPQNMNFLDITLERGELWADRARQRRAEDGAAWYDRERFCALAEKRPRPGSVAILRR